MLGSGSSSTLLHPKQAHQVHSTPVAWVPPPPAAPLSKATDLKGTPPCLHNRILIGAPATIQYNSMQSGASSLASLYTTPTHHHGRLRNIPITMALPLAACVCLPWSQLSVSVFNCPDMQIKINLQGKWRLLQVPKAVQSPQMLLRVPLVLTLCLNRPFICMYCCRKADVSW